MTPPSESPLDAETTPAEPDYEQSAEDECLWRAHVDYVRRTAQALQVSLSTARRAIAQAGFELQDLKTSDCGGDCCVGYGDHDDADHEITSADRSLRHAERVAQGVLLQLKVLLGGNQ